MQRLEVSGAVRPPTGVVRRQRVNSDRIESGGMHVKCAVTARVFGLASRNLRTNVKKIPFVRHVQQRLRGANC